MAAPTTSIFLNSTLPAADSGFQNAKPRSDGATPQQSITHEVPNTGGASIQTTSYTAVAGDCGKLIVFNSASAVTLTLPAAIPFGQWTLGVQNIGAGALSVAPGGSLHLDGGTASVVLAQNSGISIQTDGTNYFSERGGGASYSGAANLIVATPDGATGAAVVRAMVGNDLPTVAGVAGTYASPSSITVDTHGRVTAAAGSTPGYGSYAAGTRYTLNNGANTVPLTYTVPAGHTVIIGVAVPFDNFNTPGLAATDSAGNTWSTAGLPATAWYGDSFIMANNVVGGTLTINLVVTVHEANQPTDIYIFDVAGVATSSPLDGSAGQAGHSSYAAESPSITTTTAGDLLLGIVHTDSSVAYPSSTVGFNVAAQFQNSGGDRVTIFTLVAPAGTYANTVSYPTTPGASSNCIIALKGSYSAATGVTSYNGRTGAVVPASGDYTAAQVTGAATQAAIQQESYTYSADTGAANAYAVTLSPTPTVVAGSVVTFKAANTNTGASTLAVNGGTAKALVKNGTNGLAAGDVAAGQIITAKYDGTSWQIIVPGTGGGSSISLTTTGTSGAATLTGSVLNIPIYGSSGGASSPGHSLTAPIASNFAWVNQGGASLDSTNSQLSILAPATSGESWRILETTLPGAYPWTLTAAIICQMTFQNNYNAVGIGVKDSGNNKMLVYKGIVSDTGALHRSVTSYSNASSGVANLTFPTLAFPPSYLMWLRIVADATNFTYFYSPNGGISWVQLYQAGRTAYLTSPATAFFAVNADASWANAASLVSWTLA
jgi:hypothetical protein